MSVNLTKEQLYALDHEISQEHWAKIDILDMEENFVCSIQGRVISGNLSLDGSSNIRRTLNLTLIADEYENDLSNIDNNISLNKRIRAYEGIENNGIKGQPDILWIPLGIFLISQPNISHTRESVTISLTCKDKMVLLNGEAGGSFPISITFHEYDQRIGYNNSCNTFPLEPNTWTVYELTSKPGEFWRWNGVEWKTASYNEVGTVESVPQRIYDIIQTVVCNYGGIPISKIFINDVDLMIKQLVRFTGTGKLYYNMSNHVYTLNTSEVAPTEDGTYDWKSFNYNEDIGYVYTDFVFPGKTGLVTAIGDNVCTVLDKIIEVLGNYEYFFDINGNFIFQEIKNYLNNSYLPIADKGVTQQIDSNGLEYNGQTLTLDTNNLSIMDKTNYKMDVKSNSKVVYNFTEGDSLISSYTNVPNYNNIKNDFHIWGKNDNKSNPVIHYHLAIKKKPTIMNTYKVIFMRDNDGSYNGRIRLMTAEEYETLFADGDDRSIKIGNVLTRNDGELQIIKPAGDINTTDNSILDILQNGSTVENEILSLSSIDYDLNYVPADWRAELYLQGLTKQSMQIRPDVFEQELLDLFDSIYDFKKKEFKMDLVKAPNDAQYFFDYLEPTKDIINISVDAIGDRVMSYQQDNIKRMFNTDVPNYILINNGDSAGADILKKKCEEESENYIQVDESVYNSFSIGTYGYTAKEVMRNLLYQHSDLSETITLNAIPIYHLEPNTRITVNDSLSGIKGDYVIKNINLPLGGQGSMTITATRALERI